MAPHTNSSSEQFGIWGLPTATIDWCEENYVLSSYIAEFFNTISNLAIIIPALCAAWLSFKRKYEGRTILSYLALSVVGIGSWWFHMTLLYSMQLLDELPMLWGTNAVVYSQLAFTQKAGDLNTNLVLVMVIYCLGFTAAYIWTKIYIIFLVGYGLLVVQVVFSSITICRRHESSPRLLGLAVMSYFGGFVLWNLENQFCRHVRVTRDSMPTALGPVTQLHAWWHVLAGMGTFLTILYITDARLRLLKKSPSICRSFYILPFVECKVPSSEDAAQFVSTNNNYPVRKKAHGYTSKTD